MTSTPDDTSSPLVPKLPSRHTSRWHQFNALLRKQAVLQKRQKKTNLCQCLFPLFLLLILVLTAFLSKTLTEKTTPNLRAPTPVPGVVTQYRTSFGNIPIPYAVATGVSASDAAKLFNVSGTYTSTGIYRTLDPPLSKVFLPAPQAFASKAAIDEYLYSVWGVQYIAASGYLLNTYTANSISYTVYYNESVEIIGGGSVRGTNRKGQDIPGPMLATTRSAINIMAQNQGKNVSYSVQYSKLPTKEDTTFVDFTVFVQSLYFTWILHFLMPVFTESIVYEKEHKLRDMMRMMGLSSSVYWIVQYLFDWILYSVIVAVLCIFGNIFGLRFFLYNDAGLYVILFFIWGFTLIAMSFFASTLFRTTRASTITLYFFIILAGIAADVTTSNLVDDPDTPQSAFDLSSLIPTFALNRALYYLSTASAGRNSGVRMQDGNRNGNQIFSCYGFLIGEAVFFYLLFALIEFWPAISAKLGLGEHARNQKLEQAAAAARGHSVDIPMEAPEVAAERARVEKIYNASDKSSVASDFRGVVIRNLHKRFVSKERDITAVRDLSFVIPENCLTAVLGHNGAGKTTTINMLSGMFLPTSGEVFMGGYDLYSEMSMVYPMMGVCAQFDLLWENQTGREHMLFFGRIKGLKGKELEDAVVNGLKSVNLTDFQNVRVVGYSGGMKRRLSVAIALIGDPKVVFLDEPSTGLDPHSRREVWDAIQAAKKGRAMILTTHSMEEADALSDRIAVMNHGRLVAIGHSEELKVRYGHGYRLSVAVADPPRNDARCKEWVLSSFVGATLSDSLNGVSHFSVPYASVRMSDLFRRFEEARASLGINEFGISKTTLEEVFETLTTKDDMQVAAIARRNQTVSNIQQA